MAVEMLLSGEVDDDTLVATYRKYNAEIKTGKHGGYSFIPLKEAVTEKDLQRLRHIVSKGYQMNFEDRFQLMYFLQKEFCIDPKNNDYTSHIGDLKYTFSVAKKREKLN
jgi:hypothetical protein